MFDVEIWPFRDCDLASIWDLYLQLVLVAERGGVTKAAIVASVELWNSTPASRNFIERCMDAWDQEHGVKWQDAK